MRPRIPGPVGTLPGRRPPNGTAAPSGARTLHTAVTPILDDIVAEGERLLEPAARDGVSVRMLGGVAVRLQAPTVPAVFSREYKDIDFAVPKGDSAVTDRLRQARAGAWRRASASASSVDRSSRASVC